MIDYKSERISCCQIFANVNSLYIAELAVACFLSVKLTSFFFARQILFLLRITLEMLTGCHCAATDKFRILHFFLFQVNNKTSRVFSSPRHFSTSQNAKNPNNTNHKTIALNVDLFDTILLYFPTRPEHEKKIYKQRWSNTLNRWYVSNKSEKKIVRVCVEKFKNCSAVMVAKVATVRN